MRACARFDAALGGDEGDDNGDGVYARVRVRDEVLAARLGCLLSESSEFDMEGLHVNDALFFTRYAVGDHLEPHVDGTITGDDKRTVSVRTLLVYVNDAYEGGETVLLESDAPEGRGPRLRRCSGAGPGRAARGAAGDVRHQVRPPRGHHEFFGGELRSTPKELRRPPAAPPAREGWRHGWRRGWRQQSWMVDIMGVTHRTTILLYQQLRSTEAGLKGYAPPGMVTVARPDHLTPGAMATTLVLGHGRYFAEADLEFPDGHYIRCSPIDKRLWLDLPHTSVDFDPEVRPDIVYDLRVLPWAFARDGGYDRIIDTCGLAIDRLYTTPKFIAELDRVLTPGGTFFGRRGFVFSKDVSIIRTGPPVRLPVASSSCPSSCPSSSSSSSS